MASSATVPLSDYKALIFDVYGTLVDWESGIYTALQPLLSSSPKAKDWSRHDALVALESVEKDLQVRYPDMLYADLLAKAHGELRRRLNAQPSGAEPSGSVQAVVESSSGADATTSAGTSAAGTSVAETSAGGSSASEAASPEDIAFGASIPRWPTFPDTPSALARLSKAGYKLVVLSNVDRASFSHTQAQLQNAGGFEFDLVLTAQDVGAYKPDTKGFEQALKEIKEKFGVERSAVLSVAQSLYHDHVPANSIGLRSVHINRAGAGMGAAAEGAKPTWKFATLAEFADAVEQEKR